MSVNMTSIYKNYPESTRQYIDLICPFKVGDVVQIHKSIITSQFCRIIEFRGRITDIAVLNKGDLLRRIDFAEKTNLAPVFNINDSTLSELIPEFTLFYTFEEKLPKEKWWKFWERQGCRECTSSIDIDRLGCEVDRTKCVEYHIKLKRRLKEMTREDFFNEVKSAAEARPKFIRYGQAVFNYVDENYGVARAVQFEDRVDCFYNDSVVDDFLEHAYKRLTKEI